MYAYTSCCFVRCLGFRQGDYVCNTWKYLYTSSRSSMGTTEELLFEDYHRSNATFLLLFWLCTRKSWRSFHVALWELFITGTFNNTITCVHSISVSLPASTVSSFFILVDWRFPWYFILLAFTLSLTAAGASFAVYSFIIGSDPERSCLYVTVELETELPWLGSRGDDRGSVFCSILFYH